MSRTQAQVRGRKRTFFFLVGGVLLLGTLAFMLEQRYRPGSSARGEVTNQAAPGAAAAPGWRSMSGGATKEAPPQPVAKQLPPWEATPENTPPPEKGYTPAWVIKPPRPDPTNSPPSPVPDPPPDPRTWRPSMGNPGGVNGDRPARPKPEERRIVRTGTAPKIRAQPAPAE